MKPRQKLFLGSYRKILQAGFLLAILILLLLITGCSQSGAEAISETQVEIVEPTQLPESTSTSTIPPTLPPPTDTPEPTSLPAPTAEPTEGIKREQVSVSYEDKTIRGTMVGDGDIAVVLAPMFGESRGNWMHFAEYIAPLGFTVLAFDFPGPFGNSTGEFKFDKVQFDALAVIKYLRDLGYERIVCMGASIGADACFKAALIDPSLAGFVIISAPEETTEEEAAVLSMPKLLITGDEEDVKDPLETTYQLLPDPKQFEFINQKAHGTEMLNTGDELRDILVDFLESLRSSMNVDTAAQASNFEAPYEDRIIRGKMIGEGEIAVILAPMFHTTYTTWKSFPNDIASQGFTAVVFDYPGLVGNSSGEFNWSAIKYDTKAVIDYLFEQGYEKIVCIGASLGANGCFDAAQLEPNLAGLVIISDGLSAASEEGSAALLMPKLLVQGDEDEETTNTMQNIYQTLPMPKELVVLPYQAHGTELLKSSDDLRSLLLEFLNSLQ